MNDTNSAAKLYTFQIRDLRFPTLPPRTDSRFSFSEEKAAENVKHHASCGGRIPVEVVCVKAE